MGKNLRLYMPDVLQVVQACLAFLRDEVKAEPSAIETYKAAAKAVFPNATILKTAEEVAAQKQAIETQRQQEREAGNEDNK